MKTNKKQTVKKVKTTATKKKSNTSKNKAIYDFFVLDRSGSMAAIKESTITGVNEYINTSKADAKKNKIVSYFSMITFDHEFNTVYDYANINDVEELTNENFIPRGNTALHDATGRAIASLKEKLKGKESDKNVDVTITIFTDGQENSSREYTHKTIAELIKQVQDEYKWTITFIGAGNRDAVMQVAQNLNINVSNFSSYTANAADTLNMMSTMTHSRGLKTANYAAGVKTNIGYFTPTTTTTTTTHTK